MTIILPILQFAKQLSDDHEGEWAFDDDDSGSVAESFDETKIKRDRDGQFAKQEGRSSAKSDASAVADKAPISDSGPKSSGDPKKPRPIDTPEFKRWFGDSKVVDENGKPLRMYHGTNAAFDEFKGATNVHTKQFGVDMFFFTQDTQLADAYAASANCAGDGAEAVMPVYIKMEKPLIIEANGRQWFEVLSEEMSDELQTWRTPEERDFKAYGQMLREKYAAEIEIDPEFTIPPEEEREWEDLRKSYEAQITNPKHPIRTMDPQGVVGYDGMIVRNVWDRPPIEHDETDSYSPYADVYVVFSPTQVKSATGNRGTFDPSSPKITESSSLELSRDGEIRQITTRPVARESQGMTLRQAATGLAQALVHQSAPPEPDRYHDAVVAVARRVSEFCNVPAAVLLQRHIDPAVFGPWKPRAIKAQESVSWQRAPDVLEDWTPYRGERGGTGWQWNGQGEPRYQEEKPSEPGGESSNIQPDPANRQEVGPVGAVPAVEKPEGGKMKVQRFKRNAFVPAEEQSADEMAQWQKPGHLIVAGQDGGPMHKTFDSSSPVTIRSRKIGAELPEGTVVDKRLVYGDDGVRVEYLVKPRSKKADSEFADKKELARLQELLDVDPDAPTEHRNKLRQQIADIQSRLERPKTSPKSPAPVAQKPAEPTSEEKPKPASKPQPRELTELEKLKGQAKTLRGLLDRGASGKLYADYAARLAGIQEKIKSLE